VRICRSPSTVRGASDDHAFVRFADTRGAERALRDPNCGMILGQRMVVKLADSDVAPKLKSGMSESEWIYCRGLPPNFPADDVLSMFSQFGRVLDMKYFASTAMYKGTGALLRYTCVEHAKQAIDTLNETTFSGCFQPLLVRYADSPAEKAAKMTRKDLHAKNNARTQPLRDAMISMAHAIRSQDSGESDGPLPSLPSSDYPGSPSPRVRSHMVTGSEGVVPEMAPVREGQAPPGQQSQVVVVSGLPENCDKLWVYENFAVFGAIVGVVMGNMWTGSSNRMTMPSQLAEPSELVSEDLGRSGSRAFNNSMGLVGATITYVTAHEATKARDAMHGLLIGNSTISVTLEYGLPDVGMLANMSRALSAMHHQYQQHQQHQQQQHQQQQHHHQQQQQEYRFQEPRRQQQQHESARLSASPPRSSRGPESPRSARGAERSFPDGSNVGVDPLISAVDAMKLMSLSPYSSGFSDAALGELARQLSSRQNGGDGHNG
jgi:RNA recognition motif-containing protein